MNMDELHFILGKRRYMFKIKAYVGSFICDTRLTGLEEDVIVKHMCFKPSLTWSYDPFIIISDLRVKFKTKPYIHTPIPEIDKFIN